MPERRIRRLPAAARIFRISVALSLLFRDGLAPAFRSGAGESIGITITSRPGGIRSGAHCRFHASRAFLHPAVNLFTKRADRIQVTGQRYEYHLVADRAAPLNYEIHSVQRVVGHSSGNPKSANSSPSIDLGDDRGDYGAYYSLRREPRVLSDTARRNGTRTGYVGSEVYLRSSTSTTRLFPVISDNCPSRRCARIATWRCCYRWGGLRIFS